MLLLLAALAALLPVATPSSGDDLGQRAVELAWAPAPGCPSSAEVAEDLRRLSGGSVEAAAAGDARISATIRPGGEGYVLALAVRDARRTEQRTLEAPNCRTLAHAVALLTVVTLGSTDTLTGLASSTLPPPPGPERPPALSPRPETRPRPLLPPRTRAAAGGVDRPGPPIEPEPPRERGRGRAHLGVFAGPAAAVTPAVTAMLGGELGWTRGALGLHLAGWHAFASERSLEPGVGVGAAVSAGGLHVRYDLQPGPVSIPLSAGIEAGLLAGSGVGERVSASPVRAPWAAGVVGVGVAWPAQSRLAVRLSADAMITLVRAGIHLQRDGSDQEVFRVPPVGARVLLGPVLRLP